MATNEWRKETVLPKSKHRRVVLAMDGSHHSDDAFDWYLHNFRKDTDFVFIVHSFEGKSVAHMGAGSDASALSETLKQEGKQGDSLLRSFQKKLDDNGLNGEVENIPGKPGEVVVRFAHDHRADVIICGTRGHGKLRRMIMGSVSRYIIDHSNVPVVVCRHKDQMKLYNLWGQGTGKVSGNMQIS